MDNDFGLLFLPVKAQKEISLWIDGTQINADNLPVIENGRSLAPVRVISQYLGAEVNWDGAKRQVNIAFGQDNITLTIDQTRVVKNDVSYNLEVPPRIINGRTYVPLRFVSEVLGCLVQWDGAERRIDIQTIKKSLTGLSLTNINGKEALVIETEGNYSYKTFSLPNPSRYIIDLQDVSFQSTIQSLEVNSQTVQKVRVSQFSFEPLVSRVVLDLDEDNSKVDVLYQDDLGLVIYLNNEDAKQDPSEAEETNQDPSETKDTGSNVVERESLWIGVDSKALIECETTAIFNQDKEKIYGTISSARVNLRSEPSTASPESVMVTVDGGSVFEVLGQTQGWYQISYKNETAWVADWLLTLELTMKRTNVNVRKGPGSQFEVLDTVLAGEKIKVVERHLDWLKVLTPDGIEGYIAEWLVGINERLVEETTDYEQVAQSLEMFIKDIAPSHINIGKWPNIVKDIEMKRHDGGTLVVVELNEPIGYEITELEDGFQVFFGAIMTDIEVQSAFGRMSVDLQFNSPTKYVVYQNFAENILILDFPYSQSDQQHQFDPANDLVSNLEIINRVDSMQLRLNLNHIGSYKLNTIGYNDHIRLELLDSSLQGKVIAIDPGHGGSDPGAMTAGITEADINLAVALKVRDLLAQKGVSVIMTRDTDRHVSLEERVTYVNNMGADMMISIHTNSSTRGIGSGIETFYYPKPENQRLAGLLQDAVVSATGFISRGIKPYGWYVTKNTIMPSALIELGFINNKAERQILTDDISQQRIAENIIIAIEKFFMD